jgi:hypothetical protein
MFIKSLRIENFRSYRDTSFQFGKVNLIRGHNNSGKSSLAMAIEYVLTGRCEITTEAGVNGEKLIRTAKDAREATITAEILANNGLPQVVQRRRTSRNSAVVGDTGFDKDILSAALRAGRFLELSPAAQKELLADLMIPDPITVPEDLKGALDLALGFATTKPQTLESVRELEKEAIKLRAECTATLRELGEPPAAPPIDPEAPTAKGCLARLDKLRSEQNCLTREKEAKQNKWSENSRRAREAVSALAVARQAVLDTPAERELLDAIENEAASAAAFHEINRVRAQVADLKAQLDRARLHAGKCPTCGHETDIDELVKVYDARISAAESRIPGLEATSLKYLDPRIAAARLAGHRNAVADVSKYKRILDECPADERPPDFTEIDAKIADTEERIQRGQEITTKVAADEQARTEHAAKVKQRQGIEEKRAAADKIAKWAAPGEAQATMTGSKMGAFQIAINDVLHAFGYDVQIPGPDLEMLIGPFPIGQQLRTSQLSESEQFRFSVAFQVALAKVSGLGLVVLDGADVLVGPNRGILMETIMQAGLDQVFVLASTTDLLTPAPAGIYVFSLAIDEQGITTHVPIPTE